MSLSQADPSEPGGADRKAREVYGRQGLAESKIADGQEDRGGSHRHRNS